MIELKLQKNNTIKIITEEFQFLKDIKEHFTEFVEGCFFMPLYKSGQ
jgi:hypothetical protein